MVNICSSAAAGTDSCVSFWKSKTFALAGRIYADGLSPTATHDHWGILSIYGDEGPAGVEGVSVVIA